MSLKNKYRCVFWFKKQVYTEYIYAFSEKQAWLNMCRRIAKKRDDPINLVISYFDGSQKNYKIEIKIAFTEAESWE